MFKHKSFYVGSVVLTLILVLMMAVPALATGESVSVDAFATGKCSGFGSGTVSHVNGTAATQIRFILTNNSKGTTSSFSSGILSSGTYGFSISIPGSTAEGDSMTMKINLKDAGGTVLASDSLNYSCGGSTKDEGHCPVFFDGRINNCDTFNPVVLYGGSYIEGLGWDLYVYAADGSGLIWTVDAATIAAVEDCPAENTLIAENAALGIVLYRRPSCDYYLHAPMNEPGKYYIIIFNELFANAGYESWTEFIGGAP